MKKLITDKNRKWWILATVCFGLFMISLDGTVVNLAIPKIMLTFGANMSQVEWINNAYLLAFAMLLITLGRLGDSFGRRLMFMLGLVVFTIGSVFCGGAGSVNQLIFCRVIQGIGAASMMPATLSLISANFEKKERGLAMGIWGAVSGISVVLGPILGGYLTEYGLGSYLNHLLGVTDFWRYVFYINVPVGIIAFIIGLLVIKESKDHERKHNFDIIGFILSTVSIFLLTYGIIEGTKYGWFFEKNKLILLGHRIALGSIGATPIILTLSIILLAIFILHELRVKKDPLMDLKMFKSHNFSVGNLSGAVLNFAMTGALFLLPLFIENILGFSSIRTGEMLIPLAIALMVASITAGKLSDKLGAKYIITIGMLVIMIALFYLGHFTLDTTPNNLILPFIVLGLGIGLAVSPLTNMTLYDVPENEVGDGSGVFSTTKQIGQVMGIAILGAVLQTVMITKIQDNVTSLNSLTVPEKDAVIQVTKGNNFSLTDESSQKLLSDKLSGIMINEAKASQTKDMLENSIPQSMLQNPIYQETLKQKETEVETKLVNHIKSVGQDVSTAGKQGFVDSINETFRIAAIIALGGAACTLLFKNRRAIKKKLN
jgi:EmrB/QacA subfamily drug resistance transporter